MRRYYLRVGLASIVFFTAVGVGSVLAAHLDPSFKNPRLAMWMFGIVYSCFLLLGISLVLAYRVYRLAFGNHRLRCTDLFRHREVAWADVVSVRWRRWPRGGSVVVRDRSGTRIPIDLENFTPAERSEIIDLLREAVDPQFHADWEAFEQHHRRRPPQSDFGLPA